MGDLTGNVFRNEWFLEIDCDFKIEKFCFFKEELQFPCTPTSLLLSSPTRISWALSGSQSSVAGTQPSSWTAASWTAASWTWGWAISVLSHCSLPRRLPCVREDFPPGFLPLLGGQQLLTLIPLSPAASFCLRVTEKRVETEGDGSWNVGWCGY